MGGIAGCGGNGLAPGLVSEPLGPARQFVAPDLHQLATHPLEAALATTLPNERALLMSKLGRAYAAAGKNDKARETWESLANQQASPSLAAEARIRLGELLATAKKP